MSPPSLFSLSFCMTPFLNNVFPPLPTVCMRSGLCVHNVIMGKLFCTHHIGCTCSPFYGGHIQPVLSTSQCYRMLVASGGRACL